jgi:[acyl-carrier-protein] S-malonyltransferase
VSGELAATVNGQPLAAAEVAAELDRLRAGPLAYRLPPDGTPAGRQLRRWTTQRLVLRRLLEEEARARGLPTATERGLRPDPAVLGAATADVLTASAAARAVYAAVTADISIPEAERRAYYETNLDQFTTSERWVVRLVASTVDSRPSTVDGVAPVMVDPRTLPGPLRDALVEDGTIAGPIPLAGAWYVAVRDRRIDRQTRPYREVSREIGLQLTNRRKQEAFGRWLDARAGARITLLPGYEHPADPHNPDATHRH